MARGWESKSIESQVEDKNARRQMVRPPELSAAEKELLRQREGLNSSRRRVLHDLEQATTPRYREILTRALQDLDRRLAVLKPPDSPA